SLRDDGGVRKTPAFLKLADNLRFTFALGEKIFGLEIPVEYGDHGWASLKSSILVRNRVVHPKAVDDLTVSDDEMAALVRGTEWFKQWASKFMLAAHEAALKLKRT